MLENKHVNAIIYLKINTYTIYWKSRIAVLGLSDYGI